MGEDKGKNPSIVCFVREGVREGIGNSVSSLINL
jgi:hypothetical protein